MQEKLQQLLKKLDSERSEFLEKAQQVQHEWAEDWTHAENKWEFIQERLRETGTKWQLEAKEELHELGEEVDELQHKLEAKVQDVKLEVVEEVHELSEELSELYQKLRGYFNK
jgi:chromosome segregation ATPase